MKKLFLLLCFIFIVCTGCSSSVNGKAYYFEQLNVDKLWEVSKGKSQTIAFIDTGISDEARELYKDRVVYIYNSMNDSNNVEDKHGHGTQMISIASGNGEEDVWGIAPESKIIIVKAIGEEGSGDNPDSILKAIDFAISKKVDIINMSFGSFVSNPEVQERIEKAIKNNITVVASTGDYGNKDTLFPANMDGVVSVQAKDQKGMIWENSNTSEKDVVAFAGVEVSGLTLNNEIVEMNGTSQATAIASGYIALLRDYYEENNFSFDNEKLIEELKSLNSTKEVNVNYLAPFKN